MAEAPDRLRADKWLWQARFFKTRALCATLIQNGGLRVDGVKISKPAHMIKPGETLVFQKNDHIRMIQIDAIGTRRGPAPEAQALYTDLDPPQPREKKEVPHTPKFEGKGRPTGRDARRLRSFTQSGLD